MSSKNLVFGWRATVVGAVALELVGELGVLVTAIVLTRWMSVLHLPWHAAGLMTVGLASVTVMFLVHAGAGLQDAVMRPRLHAMGVDVPATTSWEVGEVLEHAEIALGLARDFHRRGQHALARQMVDGVVDLVRSVLSMERSRERIARLPGDQNEAAVERCAVAMREIDQALVSFSIELAEAGGAEEWNAARVDDALGRAANATAIANAMNEVARCA